MEAMSVPGKWELVPEEDYLRGELLTDQKHEYVGGIIHAMAGATNRHNDIAVNCVASLRAHLRGTPCKPCNSDTKVRIRLFSGTRYYYPDAMVVCRPNPDSDTFQDQPTVIIEVLSDSTRRTDEEEKGRLPDHTEPGTLFHGGTRLRPGRSLPPDDDRFRTIGHRRSG